MEAKERVKIFLVDDDPIYLKILEKQFSKQPEFIVKSYSSSQECINHLPEKPDVVFLDYNLEESQTGLNVIDKIKEIDSDIDVVILSAMDNLEVAVNCMKHDAFDYIIKNETTFIRAEKAIINIMHYKKARHQRKLAIYTSGVIVLVAIAAAILQYFFPGIMNK